MYTFFVLDFDGTYDLEDEDELGVTPAVYLIPLEKQILVEQLARMASEKFMEDDTGSYCIGDYFEEFLNENNIYYQRIGSIELSFGERQLDYLADYIPREVV